MKTSISDNIIAILRCLYLKTNDIGMYKKLLNLQSSPEAYGKTSRQITKVHVSYDIVRILIYFRFQTDILLIQTMKSVIDLDDFEDEELSHIAGLFLINSHEVPTMIMPVQAVYENASLIEHSCVNNASKHFDTAGNIVIRAAVNIRKGDRISIMYSDPMWGTASRQMHLFETKFFLCKCSRCKAP